MNQRDLQGKRLLIVDDEPHIAQGLKLNFELEGFVVETAGTGKEAAERLALAGPFDVMVLDVMLPDIDGFSLCRKMRDAGNLTPVLMLTARDVVSDRVTGFESGADDYLTKPFELKELIARVNSLLRRRGWEQERTDAKLQRWHEVGKGRVNFETCEAEVEHDALHLTSLEMDLLRYFLDNPARVLSREELRDEVWKVHHDGNPRMVDNFIVRLRRHFEEDPSNPVIFCSVRGRGYRYQPSSKEPNDASPGET